MQKNGLAISKKEFLRLVEENVIPQLKKHEEERQKILKSQKRNILLLFLFPIVIFVTAIFNNPFLTYLSWFCGFAFFVVVIAWCLSNEVKEQLFTLDRKNELKILNVLKYLSNFDFKKNSTIKQLLKNANLFNKKYRSETDTFFSGCLHNTHFFVEEKILYTADHADDLFEGIVIAIPTTKKMSYKTIVQDTLFRNVNRTNYYKINRPNLQEIEIEDIEFMKEYSIYSANQIEARRLLTPIFIERVKKLKEIFNAKYMDIAFLDGYVLIALDTKKNMFETFLMNNSITDSSIFGQLYDEMEALSHLIKTLKIDNVK